MSEYNTYSIKKSYKLHKTFFQLQRLFKLKSFVEELARADASFELNWSLLEEIGAALDIVARTTTALQRENIYLSDIYAEWLLLIDQLEELKTEYAQTLVTLIHERFKTIFNEDSKPMLACVWMDPRYQISLTADQRLIAKSHLLDLHRKIVAFGEKEEIGTPTDGSSEPQMSISRLEKLMRNFEKCSSSSIEPNVMSMESVLQSFDSLDRLPPSTDPLKFWSSKKSTHPQMYELARVVFAVPGTQAAVERTFSSLDKIITKFRGSLSDKTIERIMFMRCNRSIFGANPFCPENE